MKLWVESGAKEAFEKLKKILSSAPILHAPNFSHPFVMESLYHTSYSFNFWDKNVF